MAVNKYFFENRFPNEQGLVQSLVDEAIQIHGQEIVYIFRDDSIDFDKLLGEDPSSKFESNYLIEMYLQTVDGFQGDKEFISRFGLEIRNQATFVVSRKRFKEVTGQIYPQEGDLLYLPIAELLMEIKFVDDETPFYQLGKNYVYTLVTEAFRYSHEKVQTGRPYIDKAQTNYGFREYITLGTDGTGDFSSGNQVYQNGITGGTAGSNITIAEVVDWNSTTRILTLQNVSGDLDYTQSGVTAYITKFDNSAYYDVVTINSTVENDNEVADNSNIQIDFDNIKNTTETNPFGVP